MCRAEFLSSGLKQKRYLNNIFKPNFFYIIIYKVTEYDNNGSNNHNNN